MPWQDDPFRLWRKPVVIKRRRRTPSQRDTIWFRPIRSLLDNGIPAMPITFLMIQPQGDRPYPVGALCKTRNNRLIYWPLLTSRSASAIERDQLIDHITLELPSGRSHRTGYDGKTPWRDGEESKLVPVDNHSMSYWFANGVDWDTIRHEPLIVGSWITTPKSDEARRLTEFKSFAEKMTMLHLPHEPRPSDDSFLLSYFFLTHDNCAEPVIPSPLFPSLRNLLPNLEDQTVAFRGQHLTIGDIKLVWTCGWIRGSIPGSTLMVVPVGD